MRALAVAVIIIAIIAVFATLAMNIEPTFSAGNSNPGNVEAPIDGGGAGADLVVDREDDAAGLSCSPAPNDCTLRSAIDIANRDNAASVITFDRHMFITLNARLPVLNQPGTTITAGNMDIHLNGRGVANSILVIASHDIVIDGLLIYGASAQNANILINGLAYNVRIVNNVIGDDDRPAEHCGANDLAYAGIYIDASSTLPEDVDGRVYILNNIIECHRGQPGAGIIIVTNGVFVGEDTGGRADVNTGNVIRHNNGTAVVLHQSGNTVRNTRMFANGGTINPGTFHQNNFINNVAE